jgi:hypothetical protein
MYFQLKRHWAEVQSCGVRESSFYYVKQFFVVFYLVGKVHNLEC